MTCTTLTVGLPNFGSAFERGEWHKLIDMARAADGAGIDRISVFDHVVMGSNTDGHIWTKFPVSPDAPWLEPLTLLGAVRGGDAARRASRPAS